MSKGRQFITEAATLASIL